MHVHLWVLMHNFCAQTIVKSKNMRFSCICIFRIYVLLCINYINSFALDVKCVCKETRNVGICLMLVIQYGGLPWYVNAEKCISTCSSGIVRRYRHKHAQTESYHKDYL